MNATGFPLNSRTEDIYSGQRRPSSVHSPFRCVFLLAAGAFADFKVVDQCSPSSLACSRKVLPLGLNFQGSPAARQCIHQGKNVCRRSHHCHLRRNRVRGFGVPQLRTKILTSDAASVLTVPTSFPLLHGPPETMLTASRLRFPEWSSPSRCLLLGLNFLRPTSGSTGEVWPSY